MMGSVGGDSKPPHDWLPGLEVLQQHQQQQQQQQQQPSQQQQPQQSQPAAVPLPSAPPAPSVQAALNASSANNVKCTKCGTTQQALKQKNMKLKPCPCRKAQYCNTECQKNDWKRHKEECNVNNGGAAKCTHCGTTQNQLRAQNIKLRPCPCRKASYCNMECQKNDWKRHKEECSANGGTSSKCTACGTSQEQLRPQGIKLRPCPCRKAQYCNTECQKEDWKRHKADCTYTRNQRPSQPSPSAPPATSQPASVGVTPQTTQLQPQQPTPKPTTQPQSQPPQQQPAAGRIGAPSPPVTAAATTGLTQQGLQQSQMNQQGSVDWLKLRNAQTTPQTQPQHQAPFQQAQNQQQQRTNNVSVNVKSTTPAQQLRAPSTSVPTSSAPAASNAAGRASVLGPETQGLVERGTVHQLRQLVLAAMHDNPNVLDVIENWAKRHSQTAAAGMFPLGGMGMMPATSSPLFPNMNMIFPNMAPQMMPGVTMMYPNYLTGGVINPITSESLLRGVQQQR